MLYRCAEPAAPLECPVETDRLPTMELVCELLRRRATNKNKTSRITRKQKTIAKAAIMTVGSENCTTVARH